MAHRNGLGQVSGQLLLAFLPMHRPDLIAHFLMYAGLISEDRSINGYSGTSQSTPKYSSSVEISKFLLKIIILKQAF
jgi:hypothetical protein